MIKEMESNFKGKIKKNIVLASKNLTEPGKRIIFFLETAELRLKAPPGFTITFF
jgi:hypothetical protein